MGAHSLASRAEASAASKLATFLIVSCRKSRRLSEFLDARADAKIGWGNGRAP